MDNPVAMNRLVALSLYQVLDMARKGYDGFLGIKASHACRNMGLIGSKQRLTPKMRDTFYENLKAQLLDAGVIE